MTKIHIALDVREQAKKYQERNAIFYRNNYTKSWEGISWKSFAYQAELVSKALIKSGVQVQDNIAIFSQNSPEWIIADVAIMNARAVTVPIYATNSKSETEYIINDAEVSILFVGDQEEYDKAIQILEENDYLKLIVSLSNTVKFKEGTNSVYFNDFKTLGNDDAVEEEFQNRLASNSLDDLASIIYTSGTTGVSKGVMLTHANFVESLKAHDYELNVNDSFRSLSFLPLSHIYERSWVFFCLHRGIEVYFNEDPKKIVEVLTEVRPNVMCTVPRIFEKIYTAIQDKKKDAAPVKVKMMDWALRVGDKYYNEYKRNERKIPFGLKIKFRLANKLVLSKMRQVFGGNIEFMPCGGAPISNEIVRYMHSFGLNIKCGYGLTETTATASLFGDTKFEFSSAGKPLHGTEIKIGPNNEVWVKGPGVMKGYYKKPEETAEVFEGEWFKTGDAGKIDEEGNLFITDRIKDLMKTSGGKYIAPQKLETALINDAFIEQIAVIGDQQKYVTALAVPSFENLKKYAEEHKITFKDIEDLVQNIHIKEMFNKRLEELQKDFSMFERIKKVTLLPKEFSIDSGEITATLKLKRKVIQQKYQELIDNMYKE